MHPTDSGKSIVVGTLKNTGLAVFDLAGQTIQRIELAVDTVSGDPRR